MQLQYLKPGYLVLGNISQQGCTTYRQHDREVQVNGRRVDEKWQSEKTVQDKEEEKLLHNTYYRLNNRLRAIGTKIVGYGYAVPFERAEELKEALSEIRREIEEYNDNATCTALQYKLTVFAIQEEDEYMAQQLYEQTTKLLSQIVESMQKGDVKRLRNLLSQTKGLDTIMPGKSAERLKASLEYARQEAKDASKEIRESEFSGGEAVMEALAEKMNSSPIMGARMAFVELADEIEEQAKTKEVKLPMVDFPTVEV